MTMAKFTNGSLIGTKAFSRKIDILKPTPEVVEEITIMSDITLGQREFEIKVACLDSDGIIGIKNVYGWYIP
jgi:hypothetical protein